jgi:hypothetical protein
VKTIRRGLMTLVGVVLLAMAGPAGAHVAEVTTSVALADVQDSASLHRVIEMVVDRARSETIAFTPSVVAVTGLRVLGDRVLIGLLFADEDGEAMLRDLRDGGTGHGEEGTDHDDTFIEPSPGRPLRI